MANRNQRATYKSSVPKNAKEKTVERYPRGARRRDGDACEVEIVDDH